MEIRAIEVDGQFFEVPNYIEDSKLGDFEAYCRIKIEWDSLDKTFDLGDGVIVKFPRVMPKHKKKLLTTDSKTQKLFNERRKLIQDQLVKLMHAKSKIAKKSKKEVIQELEDRTTEILELLGRDYSVAEVHKHFKEQNINIPYPSLLRFHKRNEQRIRELRNGWREDIQDVSITIKRSRLEKLNYLLNDLLQNYEAATPLNKITYSKEIRGIIEQARKEVEGEEIKLTVTGRIDIEATISSYLNESNLLRDLTIHQMVIARVAARIGIPSMHLIERLATSFYSQFNGFRPNNDLSGTIIYPSSVNYDILDLENKNKLISAPKEVVKERITPIQQTRIDLSRQKIANKIDELIKRNENNKKNIT